MVSEPRTWSERVCDSLQTFSSRAQSTPKTKSAHFVRLRSYIRYAHSLSYNDLVLGNPQTEASRDRRLAPMQRALIFVRDWSSGKHVCPCRFQCLCGGLAIVERKRKRVQYIQIPAICFRHEVIRARFLLLGQFGKTGRTCRPLLDQFRRFRGGRSQFATNPIYVF